MYIINNYNDKNQCFLLYISYYFLKRVLANLESLHSRDFKTLKKVSLKNSIDERNVIKTSCRGQQVQIFILLLMKINR